MRATPPVAVDHVARVVAALLDAQRTQPIGLTAAAVSAAAHLSPEDTDRALAAAQAAQLVRVHRLAMTYVPTLAALHEAHVSGRAAA